MEYLINPNQWHCTVDEFDIANFDTVVGRLCYNMLVRYKDDAKSTFYVDNNDVPPELRGPGDPEIQDENWNDRWHFVLDQMIWSFSHYHKEGHKRYEDFIVPEKMDEYTQRLQFGLALFGKYFQGLYI